MGLIKKFGDLNNVLHKIHLDAVYDIVGNVETSLRTLLEGKANTNHTQSTSTITGLDAALANLTNLLGLKEISSNKIHSLASRPANNALYPDAQIVYDALERKVGEYQFSGSVTSGEQRINLDTYLKQKGMAGMFHIYNGRDTTVNLDDLLTSSIEVVNFTFFGNWKNIGPLGQVMCHICRHDTETTGTYYLVYVINRDEKVTSLSSQSTNLQYPSAKCVYDELQAIKARLSALEA